MDFKCAKPSSHFQKMILKDIHFYDSILSVNESTLKSVKESILDLNISQEKNHFEYFLKLLIKAPTIRPKSTKFFNSILEELIPDINKAFTSFEISTMFQNKAQVLLLIEKDVMKVNQIYSQCSNDLSFFVYFYDKLINSYSSFCQRILDENKAVKDFINKTDMKKFKVERLKFLNQDPIAISIRNDDVDDLIRNVYNYQHQKKASNLSEINIDELNFDIQVQHSFIENTGPINDINKMPSLIEYSAFYCSNKVFNFLEEKLNRKSINSSDLAYFASIGGNIEVIRHLLDKKVEFDERCLKGAIEYHQYEASNLICPHPNFSSLLWSVNQNNFKYFYDHLDVLLNDQSYSDSDFLRLFDFCLKKLPLYFLELLFNSPKSRNCSLFSKIAKSCNLEIIKTAIGNIPEENLNINEVDNNGFNALHYACLNGSKEIADCLLSHPKIDPNAVTNAQDLKIKYYQMTPLHLVSLHQNIEICELLLKHPKIDVNKPIEKNLITPLMTAAANHSNKVVDALLRCPMIKINSVDKQGQNALHHAIIGNSLESVKSLLLSNIDMNAKTTDNNITPLLLAAENNKVEIVDCFCSLDKNNLIDFSAKDLFGI